MITDRVRKDRSMRRAAEHARFLSESRLRRRRSSPCPWGSHVDVAYRSLRGPDCRCGATPQQIVHDLRSIFHASGGVLVRISSARTVTSARVRRLRDNPRFWQINLEILLSRAIIASGPGRSESGPVEMKKRSAGTYATPRLGSPAGAGNGRQ